MKQMDPVGNYDAPGEPLINVLEDIVIPDFPEVEVETEEDKPLENKPAGGRCEKLDLVRAPRERPVDKGSRAFPKLLFQDFDWAASVETDQSKLFGVGRHPPEETATQTSKPGQQNPTQNLPLEDEWAALQALPSLTEDDSDGFMRTLKRYLEVLAQQNFEGHGNYQRQVIKSKDLKGHHQSVPPRGGNKGGTANDHATLEEGSKTEPRKGLKCFVCADAHHTMNCPKFVHAAIKVEILRNYKVCIICVCHKFNTNEPKCRKQENFSCDICKWNHATIMCGQELEPWWKSRGQQSAKKNLSFSFLS